MNYEMLPLCILGHSAMKSVKLLKWNCCESYVEVDVVSEYST